MALLSGVNDIARSGANAVNDLINPNFNYTPPFSYGQQDFEFFLIEELEGPRKSVRLRSNQLPKDDLTFGGKQRIVKDYYSGYSEPVMHVLGPQENDTVIRGELKDNKYSFDVVGNSDSVAGEYQKLVDSIRIRGNLCRFVLGEWERYGFVEECEFKLKRRNKIEYEIKLAISGFNAPKNAKFLEKDRLVPFSINEDLIAFSENYLENFAYPADVPLGIGLQMALLIGEVANAINSITSFIDGVIGTIEDIRKGVQRAIGLCKYAKNKATEYKNYIANFDFNSVEGAGVLGKYDMAKFSSAQISNMGSLYAILNVLESRVKGLVEDTPRATHIVVTNETLQSIANKYYSDSAQWKRIYDYNNLTSVDIQTGDQLDIPSL